ncbi:DsbA family protein [Streptacidiphilus sp. N1-12]|uniref:DsbA family protein n=2 Tax=Streptacidiphilus alkalitolerans TaxID=3342712 RepID=A0ABV6VF27_9ACTN
MSQKNTEARRSARDRMQEERAAQEAKARRMRQFGIIGTVLAVLVVAVVVGVLVMNHKSSSYSATDAPKGTVGTNNLVIPVGADAAPSTLTVYEDPRCPACGEFETSFHGTVNKLLSEGRIKVQYHVVSFIDRHDQGSGSKNAANALACAQNIGKFHNFHDVIYANQPDETDDAWADKGKLITLAKQVPGLDTPAFESCVNGNSFGSWVTAVQTDFDKSGFSSTPTILLNGTSAYPTFKNEQISEANLVKWVDAANKGKTPAVLTPASAAALASPTAGNTKP